MRHWQRLVVSLAAVVLFASSGSAAPKNIILLISDGQGMGSVMAASYYAGERPVYEGFPQKYFMTTHSAIGGYDPDLAWDHFITQLINPTDSAASGTAMASGKKTLPGMVGKSPLFQDLKNVVETASKVGKATGVVTSVPISHATPASMVAHNISRNNYKELAREMIYRSDLDVIMGAGHPLYTNDGELREGGYEFKYLGGEETWNDLVDANGALAKDGRSWHFMDEKADFAALASGASSHTKVVGIARVAKTLQQKRSGDVQSVRFDTFNAGVPTLATMAKGAMNVLNADPEGFFLMIEGGAVDWANHDNQKGRLIEEQTAFNDAVAEVVAWVEAHSSWDETLVMVTADHECGYLWGSSEKAFVPVQDFGAGEMPGMHYHSGGHSNMPVPFYAMGAGSELAGQLVDGTDGFAADLFAPYDAGFTGAYIDNTDIFTLMNHAMAPLRETPEGMWLKGDLHAHSLHSDGDSPVKDVLESVREKGLDFFTLTEHDTSMFDKGDLTSAIPTHWYDPDYQASDIVLLYGLEWTTSKGHANVWAPEPFDCEELWAANNKSGFIESPDTQKAVRAAQGQKGLFSVNHPTAFFCCPWLQPVLHETDSLEIWNAMYHLPNMNGWASHPTWDKELRKGRRITGVGGSDTHKLNGIEAWLFGHGNPTTRVFAQSKTPEAVLEGIQKGRVSLSWKADGEYLDFTADTDGNGSFETMVGENLLMLAPEKVSFRVTIGNGAKGMWWQKKEVREMGANTLKGLLDGTYDLKDILGSLFSRNRYVVGVLKNGLLHRVFVLTGGAHELTFSETLGGDARDYYRVELIGNPPIFFVHRLLYGRVMAITNPIYVNFPAN